MFDDRVNEKAQVASDGDAPGSRGVAAGVCVARGGFVLVGLKASMLTLVGLSLAGVAAALADATASATATATATGACEAGAAGADRAGGAAARADEADGAAGAGSSVDADTAAARAVVAARAGQVALTAALRTARAATDAVLAEQFALAQDLDVRAPGASLVTALEGLDLAGVHDAVLIEAAAGWERITSLATARQGQVLAELAARRERAGLGEFTGDEVASRLVTTRAVADAKITLGMALAQAPAVHDALACGVLDHRKATALTDAVAHLDPDTAATVLAGALPVAPSLTVPALRAKVRRLELTCNPDATRDRARRERGDRHVRIAPAPGTTAMAWISALLPAEDAMTIYTAIDALAATADPADPRTVDQRRADALTDVCEVILRTGLTPTGTPLPTAHGTRPQLLITAAATTLLGLDDTPADLAGYGPIPADLAREIATDATWRRIFTDPGSGLVTAVGTRTYRPGADLTRTVVARDRTCTFPGCRMPAWRCDLDHRDPYNHHDPDAGGQTCPENLHCLCRHHHRLKTYAGWHVTRDASTGDTHWITPTRHRYTRPGRDTNPDPPPPTRPRAVIPSTPPF
ncbi:HNH endonuclease signature motif containing protein [Pengzhenrongella sicca]|uniref:DUF222 domain-containing protein n=1 Tax=Pengzhenrongella sicca TaxID=2819238 RepID=A0A8A4ZAF7_9MICO|nr:HNH endonuclease signature motif containing protein [Pengzhenrongella sicca]QTE27873.1 DUF222 domain-containing protein [Pengzhenrongella sicca]